MFVCPPKRTKLAWSFENSFIKLSAKKAEKDQNVLQLKSHSVTGM